MSGQDGAKIQRQASKETKSLLMKVGEAASKLEEKEEVKNEEASLGDLMGIMGGLMAAFAPPEQGKEIQKQFEEMGMTMGPMFEGLGKGAGAFDTPAYHWVEMKSNVLPENAFAIGKDGSETPNVYIARAEVDGKICVGKVHNNTLYGLTRYCLTGQIKEEVVTSQPFSVLCVDPKADLEWVMYDRFEFGKKELPNGIVTAGKDIFVGRGLVYDDKRKLNPGLVYLDLKDISWMHVLYGGRMHKLERFEVLVIRDKKQELEDIEAAIEEHQKELEKLEIKKKEL